MYASEVIRKPPRIINGFLIFNRESKLNIDLLKFLKNSQQIILPKTVHGGIFGKDWYGSTSKVKEWWDEINWK